MHQTEGRAYHSWSHPVQMMETMRTIGRHLHDRNAVLFATILHDVVIDFTRKDNEERSAVFAEQCLSGHVPEPTIIHTARMIRSSANHLVPKNLPPEDMQDIAYFLDLDLSILGADPSAFDAYEAGIRREYAHVADGEFIQARAAILERFLSRDNLYFTEWGRSQFEARARRNLTRSLVRLKA